MTATKTKNKDVKDITWDLKDLYLSETDPSIQRDLTQTLENSTTFNKTYKTKIKTLNDKKLLKAFQELEDILKPLYKTSQYISLRLSIETQNQALKQLNGKIEDVESEVSNNLLFFDLEIGMLPKKNIQGFLKNDLLKNYHYSIQRSHETAAYNLNESQEQIINIKDITGVNSYQNLYSELTSAFSFKFKLNGKTKTLTGPEMRNLRLHPDQKIRQKAMKLYFGEYEKNSIIFTHIFNNILKDFNTERKLRGHKKAIHVRNNSNNLPNETIEILHEVTSKSNKLVQRYYTLKKKLLKLKTMTLADIYAPLPNINETFTYKQATSLVLDGFKSFDKEFFDIAKKMFDQNRVHAPVIKHKRGGAFCSGSTPDIYPYVMLNFLGKPRDVSTMAHELGHAIHDVLASKQTLCNYHPILPLAETASVFSEMIITDLLMKKLKDKQSKIVLLCEKLEDIFATSHRQNMFSEFEQLTHEKISNTLLSDKEICSIYNTLLKKMFGNSVKITKEYKWEWAGIPHFLDYPFYVYAYNFGNLLVLALYQHYKEEGNSFIPKLKHMLAAGSSESPINITKTIGIDIQSESFWNKSICSIETLINELETLL